MINYNISRYKNGDNIYIFNNVYIKKEKRFMIKKLLFVFIIFVLFVAPISAENI